ncbi:MAG: 2-(1,2-epoxy-1,2-dihydrophenyl)acetyl-CoA isomerase PaaG [Gammaproteobacteria bacterium]|nr:MAG: 2-(1,2-epoxy-1,2-dihydrophenyl)acetyl-CoA isomerase PaaG [Gammaproteobacteria bacterium]
MGYKTIEFSVDAGVATLTLNRPKALNSFTTQMHAEVRAVMTQVTDDASIRCLVITGAGRGFCAGQDLGDRAVSTDGAPPDLGESVEKNYNPLIRSIMNLPKPVICAVNGVAAGAGSSIALACDIVLAARSASFIQVFCKIGLVPDSGGTWNLPRAVGLPRARGLAMLGDRLSADTAEDWGLIWKCVDDDALAEETQKMARYLAGQPTRALGRIKKLLNESGSNTLFEQTELEKEAMQELGQSEDYREGVAAFKEKRPAVFKGA